MRRGAILALVLLGSPGPIRAASEEAEKVSNDRPDRPLQMPPASSETKEAFDDFERFARRGAWERATKALYSIPEAQAGRFLDGKDGFIISVARKRRDVLGGLSPEGQAAYRLFYDADAKKLLDQAEGTAEQATLERLFSSYFLTSVGDDAADRLGDLQYERGHFDRAADCWLALLRERPDSEIPPARTAVKAALALARAGRRSELAALRAEVADRYADERVTIGGRKARASDHLGRLVGGSAAEARPASAADDGPPPALPATPAAAWQVRFAASVTAGMTPAELTQWEASSLSGAVPSVAVEGTRLYANYLGYVFALDLASGKMLWRSASFHNLEQAANQGFGQGADPKRFAVLAAPGYVWSLGRDPKEPGYQATSRLVCRRAESGEVVWQSQDLPDYAGIDLTGQPLLVRGTIYLAGKSSGSPNPNMGMGMFMMGMGGGDSQPRQVALAIRPHDGKILWKTEVGVFREGQRYYYYGMGDTSPQPRLAYRAGSIYLDTNQGVLARLDADSGELDWGYGYPTEPVQMQGRFIIFFNGMPNVSGPSTSAPSPLLAVGDALVVKGAGSDRICAIDPDRMKLLWERPIAKSARLLGADERTLYLGGPELAALDLRTRSLRWAAPVPGGSEEARLLVKPEGLWQLTPRGIFEIDPRDGGIRRIFRGEDAGAAGGDLVLTDRWIVAISNRTISAYPRGSAGGEKTARAGGAASRTGG